MRDGRRTLKPQTQARSVLAELARRFTFELPPGFEAQEVVDLVLHGKDGVRLLCKPRRPAAADGGSGARLL